MNLYYNKHLGKWFHLTENVNLHFGKNHWPLSNSSPSNGYLSFTVNKLKSKVGPLIGILVYKKDEKIIANREIITPLAEKLTEFRAIPVLLPIENVGNNYMDGAIYDSKNKAWVEGKFPVPDLIFNRISSRQIEKTEQFQRTVQLIQEQNIPFFNPHFIDKFEAYALFKEDPVLKQHLPDTILIQNKNRLYEFLQKWGTLYLKPSFSHKGNGILLIKETNHRKIVVRKFEIKESYEDYNHFWKKYKSHLMKKPYIAQQAISPKKVNGRRYDYRILAHGHNGQYKIVGIGVRVAGPHNVTTHIPKGGKLLPYKNFQSEHLDTQFDRIVNSIGRTLTKHYGFFGEFSIDVGESKDGRLVIYEVNSKPMSFDENDIESARLKQLCTLFLTMTGFKNVNP